MTSAGSDALAPGYGCRRLPAGRQQRARIVAGGHGRQARENIGEPDFRFDLVAAVVFDHGVDNGTALPGPPFPEKSQFFFPIAVGRMPFSIQLLSISTRPSLA